MQNGVGGISFPTLNDSTLFDKRTKKLDVPMAKQQDRSTPDREIGSIFPAPNWQEMGATMKETPSNFTKKKGHFNVEGFTSYIAPNPGIDHEYFEG